MFSTPPKGMKVKRVWRKLIEFNNEFTPVYDLPPVSSPGIYEAVVRDVCEPFVFPHFERKFYIPCRVAYELIDLSGNQYFFAEYINIDHVKMSSIKNRELLKYLENNGITNWDDFIGCQEEITVAVKDYRTIRYNPHTSKPYWHKESYIVDRKFIYEPEGEQ